MKKRAYKPRTEAQKARRRELDRIRREKSKALTKVVKKELKKGTKITPKNVDKIVKKGKIEQNKLSKKGKKMLKDAIRLHREHIVCKGDVIIFKDYTASSLYDVGRKLCDGAFAIAIAKAKNTVQV